MIRENLQHGVVERVVEWSEILGSLSHQVIVGVESVVIPLEESGNIDVPLRHVGL